MEPELIGKLGLPIAVAVVLIAFLLRVVWPFMTKQLEASQSRESAAISAFAGLKETLIQQTEINRQTVRLLERLAHRDA